MRPSQDSDSGSRRPMKFPSVHHRFFLLLSELAVHASPTRRSILVNTNNFVDSQAWLASALEIHRPHSRVGGLDSSEYSPENGNDQTNAANWQCSTGAILSVR